MAHHANDHAPRGAAVAISGSDLAELRDLLKPISEAALMALEDRSERNAPKTVVLSDAQFVRIEELLQPGYDLALKLLADRDAAKPVVDEPSIVDPPVDVGQQG